MYKDVVEVVGGGVILEGANPSTVLAARPTAKMAERNFMVVLCCYWLWSQVLCDQGDTTLQQCGNNQLEEEFVVNVFVGYLQPLLPSIIGGSSVGVWDIEKIEVGAFHCF
jgi:hypothetical protein